MDDNVLFLPPACTMHRKLERIRACCIEAIIEERLPQIQPDRRSAPTIGHDLYLLEDEAFRQYCKIGHSHDARFRLSAHRKANPMLFPMLFLKAELGVRNRDTALKIEMNMIRAFADFRSHAKEFFRPVIIPYVCDVFTALNEFGIGRVMFYEPPWENGPRVL